jgi:hypothetical protein
MIEVWNVYRGDNYHIYGGRPFGGVDPRNVEIGKHGWLGNPFRGKREVVIAKYKRYFWDRINQDPEFLEAIRALEGKRVACFCHPKPCHLDVINDWFEAGCPLQDRAQLYSKI